MFHILGIGFFFILILFIVGLMIVMRLINATGSFLGSIFNPSGKKTNHTQRTSSHSSYEPNNGSASNTAQKNNKKVFGDDEGEYIDFEEIKEQ